MASKDTRREVEPSSLCTNGCGFFGNASTLGQCSVCYKNYVKGLETAESELAAKYLIGKSKESRKNSGPVLLDSCAGNCGFVGKLIIGDNLCSKCHSAQQRKGAAVGKIIEQIAAIGAIGAETKAAVQLSKRAAGKGIEQVGESREVEAGAAAQPEEKPGEKAAEIAQKDNSCSACHKKLSLRSVLCGKCKCGELFCSTHRQAERHSCTFDYRSFAQSTITKANPLVKKDKMENRI